MITTFISFEIQKYLLHSIDASFPLLQKRKTSCKLALTNIKIFNFADQIVKKIPLYKLIYELCGNFDSKKSKSAVADGKALSLARTQLGHKVSLLIVYAERIIIISHHTKFELANLKR